MLTFLKEFFKALGMALGNNIAAVVTVAGVAFILYILLTSKRARIIIASLKEAIIKRLMVIPFVAEAVYDKTISGYEADLHDWKEYSKQLTAELASYNRELEKNLDTIEDFSNKMKYAVEDDDDNLAMEYAEKVVVAQDANKMLEEKHIPRINRAIEATNERMSNLRTLIIRTKARKDEALRNMRVGKLEERLTDELNGSNDTTESTMLAFFEERAEYQRNRGTGARMAYESTLEYKDKQVDREILKGSATQLVENCKRELSNR